MATSPSSKQQSGLSKYGDLKGRLIFLALALVVYRIGAHVPVPGIDPDMLKQLFDEQQGGILGLFNMFSGGALSRFSVFALGIMPYISASIIMQMLSYVLPELEALRKEGESGRRKITQYTRYGTLLLGLFQGFGIAVALESQAGLVLDPGFMFRITTTISLLTGTMFLMWLGEQITERGLGNGISIIIFAGIVAGLPSGTPGCSLSENPLCTRFGAPRSLIRVVLQRLQENGLVKIVPYKGTTVTRLNRDIVDELIYERIAVEARVLRDFAPHCTPEHRALIRQRAAAYDELAKAETLDFNRLYEADTRLHETWFSAMGKMYLWRTLQNAHADYSRFRMLDTLTTGGLAEVVADHHNLIDAIERCDLAAFEPLVERHLYGGIRRLGSKLTEEYADYFE